MNSSDFNITKDYIVTKFGNDGKVFIDKYNVVHNDNSKKLFIMSGDVENEDQVFYYTDSTNEVVGFNINYLQKLSSENKFYEEVVLYVKDGKLYKDSFQVNFNHCEYNIEFYNKKDIQPIYMVEYIDNMYYYLIIDGNHRISYFVDNDIEKINVRLLDPMSTILTIYDPREMFTYVMLNIYRLLCMKKIGQNNYDDKILLLLKVVNYCYETRYKKLYK